MLDTLGKRLKCCRAATSTTPQEVVAYIHANGGDLSYPTYTRWESGFTSPKRKANLIALVSDFFKEKGFSVSKEWLESGEGFPPQFAEYSNLDEDTLFILASRNLKDTELIQIGGNYGEPFVNFGEMCIISTSSDIITNNGKLCWVRTHHSPHPIIGKLSITSEKEIEIYRTNLLKIEKSDILECRRIKWILKK